ncbi:MAG: hypothetical protein U1F60_13850 [Planctomycetota bacterium]
MATWPLRLEEFGRTVGIVVEIANDQPWRVPRGTRVAAQIGVEVVFAAPAVHASDLVTVRAQHGSDHGLVRRAFDGKGPDRHLRP